MQYWNKFLHHPVELASCEGIDVVVGIGAAEGTYHQVYSEGSGNKQTPC